jgi:Flp pilus assembly pilin Flp
MKNLLKQFVREEQGQDIVEYVLLCSGIGLLVFTGLQTFGGRMSEIYEALADAVEATIA